MPIADELTIDGFDPGSASERDIGGFHETVAASQAVERPDEQRLTIENVIGRLRNPFPGFGPIRYWVARKGGRIRGIASSFFPEEENSRLALVEIIVHPDSRRQGIGTAMLRHMVPVLREEGRSFVEGWQVTLGGAGELWAHAVGMRPANTVLMQTLAVPGVDRALWNAAVSSGYRLRRWSGAAPEDLVVSYAAARRAIDDAPSGQLGYRSPVWTVDRVRSTERDFAGRNIGHRVVVAVHEESGEVAGITEIELHPHRPLWAYQRDTAVLAPHRGHGLGRCMKAHMLQWLLADHPQIELIWSTTSANNDHMSRVNLGLGYTTVRSMVAVNGEIDGLVL